MSLDPINDSEPTHRSWLVGSGDDCDVVIDHPKVSGHHCQITRSADRLTIQDVNSEHGTWVDGVPVNGPKPIRRGSSIMLGETVELLWPPDLLEFRTAITIGRSPENDVVLDKPNVSAFHARLIDNGESLWIEDCESTNGVALNRPDNLVTFHQVVSGDAIYLGSTRITIDRILQIGLASETLNSQAFAERVAQRLLAGASISEAQRQRRHRNRGALLTCIMIASVLAGAAIAVYLARAA